MSIAEQLTQLKQDFDDVYDAGKQAQQKEFMDDFQHVETGYANHERYAGGGWHRDNFYPTQNIEIIKNAERVFAYHGYGSNKPYSLKQRLIDCGVTFDSSTATTFLYMFRNAEITELPVISTISATEVRYAFYYCRKLETIDKLILKDDGTTRLSEAFSNCVALKNITIEGTIGSSVDFQWSTELSYDSIASIFDHLSTTATEQTLTFSQTAVDREIGSASMWWLAHVQMYPNWTITLV